MLVGMFLGVKKMHRNLAVLLAVTVAAMPFKAGAQGSPKPAQVKIIQPITTRTPIAFDEAEARKEIGALFADADTNKDGRLSRRELQMYGIKHRIGSLVNSRTWKRADKDRNDWLSLDEFTTYCIEERQRTLARKAARHH